MTYLEPQVPGDKADEDGFQAFFRTTYPQVVRIAFRVLGSLEAAQDVAQEVFTLAYGRYPDGVSNPAAWVRAAAVSQALNEIRSTRRRRAREVRQTVAEHAPSTEEMVVAAEERDQVRKALRRMTREKASILVLRHSGLSYGQIAEALGIRPTSVGTTLRRAEEQFRREVSR